MEKVIYPTSEKLCLKEKCLLIKEVERRIREHRERKERAGILALIILIVIVAFILFFDVVLGV